MLVLAPLISLILWHTDADAAVTIVTEPNNVTATTGSNATFACEVEGQAFGDNVLWKRIVGSTITDISTNNILTASTSKYAIIGTYNLTVLNVDTSDSGAYECSMSQDASLKKTAYLTVANIEKMVNLSLYWPGPSQQVQRGVSTALTCQTNGTDPAVTFRWFKGSEEITDQASNPTPTADSQGLYSSHSVQTLTMKQEDAGLVIRCVADIRDLRDVMETQITVQFSGVSLPKALMSLLVGSTFFALTSLY